MEKCPMCGEEFGDSQINVQYDLWLCEDCTDPSVEYRPVNELNPKTGKLKWLGV